MFQELSQIIEKGKKQVSTQINSTLTMVYWQVGHRINHDVLKNQRAKYGKELISNVSKKLVSAYGRSFAEKNLRRMMRFAHTFSDFSIVPTVSAQLSWSHFLEIIPIANEKTRIYYAQKSSTERWSVRETRRQIEQKLLRDKK